MPSELNTPPVPPSLVADTTVIPTQYNPSPDQQPLNLNDLNRESQAFAVAVSQEKKSEATDAILLLPNDNLIEQAERILRLYDAQAGDERGVDQLQHSKAAHLMRMGRMYFDAIYAPWIKTSSPANALSCGESAQRACRCYEKAFQLVHESLAALMLAEIYRIAGFSATANHWLEEASRAASVRNDAGKMDQIRQASAKLKAEEQLTDTHLSPNDVFPTRDSAGLIFSFQPVGPVPSVIPEMAAPDTNSGTSTFNSSAPLFSKRDIFRDHATLFQRPVFMKGLILLAIALVAATSATLLVQRIFRQNRYSNYKPSNSSDTATSFAPVSRSTTRNQTVSYGGDSDFSSRSVSDSDLIGKTAFQLDVMRNEPYARHGYKFLRSDMAQYFTKQAWYHATQGDQDQVAKGFSLSEKRNVDIIRMYEQHHGMIRQKGSVGTAGALASESPASWLVILGSFPVSQRAECEERLNNVQSHGFSARIINTSDYPALNPGLLAVVSGPFSKEIALTEKARVGRTISDAFIKRGT